MARKAKPLPAGTIYRLVDANVNRCREGLRVIEDTARFIIEDPVGYRKLRSVRHTFDAAVRSAYPRLLNNRNSIADSGRRIKEGARPSVHDVVAANCKRVQEALRVLEEYGKVIAPHASAVFKQVRYALYTIEKRLIPRIRKWEKHYDHH